MNDERVDELLRDLDEALSVEPSPTVAARVRTRIAEGGARWGGLAKVMIPAAVGVAVVVGYLVRPQDVSELARAPQRMAGAASAEVAGKPGASAPSRASSVQPASLGPEAVVVQPQSSRPAASMARTFAARREPEVLVSPAVRAAFDQFRADVASGRITSESFLASRIVTEPTVIVPTVIDLKPFTIDTVAVDPNSSQDGASSPSSRLADNRRSLS